MKAFLTSFVCALRGIRRTAELGRNFRLMIWGCIYVIWAGILAELSAAVWAVQLLCCALVLALECINTALEQLCDRVTREQDEWIARAKDCAAGGVLIASIFAAVIWLLTTGMEGGLLRIWEKGADFLYTVPVALWWAFRKRNTI